MSLEDNNIEDMFKVVTIDRPTKKKMTPELSLDGEPISIQDTVENITIHIKEQMELEETNPTRVMLFPLMAKAMVFSLNKLFGDERTALTWSLLSQETVRYSLINMMLTGFFMSQFIKNKSIKVDSYQEDLTDEDIEMYDRINAVSSITSTLATMGADPKDVMRELLREGHITLADLKEMGVDDLIVDDQDSKEQN